MGLSGGWRVLSVVVVSIASLLVGCGRGPAPEIGGDEISDGGTTGEDIDGADTGDTAETSMEVGDGPVTPSAVDSDDGSRDSERSDGGNRADTDDRIDGSEMTIDPQTDGMDRGRKTRAWTRLLGSPYSDYIAGTAIDGSGNVYVVGWTKGDLGGQTNNGLEDAFVAKYAPDGTRKWVHLLGKSAWDRANQVSVDGSGNVYVVGQIGEGIGNQTHNGRDDAFVARYAPDGTRKWLELLGTSAHDWARSVSVDDAGNIYVAGLTKGDLGGETNKGGEDTFVARYASDGTRRWVEVLGTTEIDWAGGVSVDGSGNVSVAGWTKGDLGGQTNKGGDDVFVASYASDGTRRWVELLGTAQGDRARSVSADGAGNVYVVGLTKGGLTGETNEGGDDIFVAKYAADGTRKWVELLGTTEHDRARSVSADGAGNVYVVGRTGDDLGGQRNHGRLDAFVVRYASGGAPKWIELYGTRTDDGAMGVSVDGSGTVYVAGWSRGHFGGETNSGRLDGFVTSMHVP